MLDFTFVPHNSSWPLVCCLFVFPKFWPEWQLCIHDFWLMNLGHVWCPSDIWKPFGEFFARKQICGFFFMSSSCWKWPWLSPENVALIGSSNFCSGLVPCGTVEIIHTINQSATLTNAIFTDVDRQQTNSSDSAVKIWDSERKLRRMRLLVRHVIWTLRINYVLIGHTAGFQKHF